MEIYKLRTFVAVAREGHLTRASELLNLSQPALSAHIKSLEEELGILLFDRTPKGMQLTHAGRLLLTQAENALAAASDLLAQARSLRDEICGAVVLGTITDTPSLRLGDFLCRMAASYPKLSLQLRQGISGTVVQGIKNRELDAGYILGRNEDPAIATIGLNKIKLYVAAPAGWKDRVEKADWPQIAALPWIITPPLCSFHRITEELFEKHNVKPNTMIAADQEITLRGLVAAGVGLSILREDQALAAEQAGEAVLWRQGECETLLSFLYLRERENEPIITAMAQVIKQVWNSGGAD